MSFDQTGVQACLAPWVTRPLPAKKSTKVGRAVFRSSFEQVFKGGVNVGEKAASGAMFDIKCKKLLFTPLSCIQGK